MTKLDKKLGFANYKRDLENKAYAKRSFMYKQIIPEQNSPNPNFKHYFYYIRLTTFLLNLDNFSRTTCITCVH